MPTDVPLGAGYTGNALLGAFPGQYRDTEEVQPDPSNYMAQLPAGQPRYVVAPPGPDNGRPMRLQNIPGVGQVVVPVEHTMIGSVVPVDHTMVGMNAVVPVDHTMVGMGHHVPEDLSGLGDLGKMHRGAQHLGQVAARAAHDALQKLRQRVFTTWAQVEALVRSRVEAARVAIEARLQKRITRLAAIAEQAVKQALAEIGPKARGVGQPEPGWAQDLAASGDWRASMMGGIKESILQLMAGPELDQLRRAMGKLQDGVVDANNRLDALRKEEAGVNARIAGRPTFVYGPLGIPLPTLLAVENLKALKSVDEGYRSLTGFDYMNNVLVLNFRANRAKLVDVYSNTDWLIGALERFSASWTQQIADKPKYVELWNQIQNAHNRLAAAAGAPGGAFDNAQYLVTAQQAVEQVLGIRSKSPAELGMADFGITALIGLIAICVTVLALAVAAVLLAKQFNAVANNMHAQQTAHEDRMETQRREFMEKCAAEGRAVEDCTASWVAARKAQDEAQAKKQAQYATTAPSALDIGKYIPWAAGIFAAVTILPKVVGLGDIGDVIAGFFG